MILVTGYRAGMALAIEAALEVGAYACFYKPLQIERLLQVLTEIYHQELGKVLTQPHRSANTPCPTSTPLLSSP
jgi:hypothetical protein